MIPQGGIDRNIQAAKLRAGSNPNVLAQEYKKTQSIETLLAMQSLKEELGKREQEIAAQMQGPEGSILEQTQAQLTALVNPQSDSTDDVLAQMAPVMDRRGKEEAKAQMAPPAGASKPPPPIQGKAPAPPNGAPQVGIAGLNPRMGMAEGGIVPSANSNYADGGEVAASPNALHPNNLSAEEKANIQINEVIAQMIAGGMSQEEAAKFRAQMNVQPSRQSIKMSEPSNYAKGGMVGYADGGEVEGEMSNEAVLAVAKLVEGGMSKKDAEAMLKKIENERIQRKRKPKANLANKVGQGARAFMDSNPEDLLPLVREGKAIVGGAGAVKDAVMDYGPSFSEVGEALAAGYAGESSPQLTGMFEKRPPPPTEPQMGGAPMRDLANQGGVKDPRSYMSTSINKPIGMRNQGNPPPQAQPQAQPEGLAALAAGVAPAPQRPMTQAEQLAANFMSRNPDDMGQASEKRYQTREKSLGIGALAERLAANSRATSAYNDKISDPRKAAWERFQAGGRNASDAGGGSAFGNYSKGSASERARQERQQQAFFETDAANIGKETALASGRLDALTSAYGSGQTRGDASQLAGLTAANAQLATEAKQRTNDLIAQANITEAAGLDFQKTQNLLLDLRAELKDQIETSQKMFLESGDASRELLSNRRNSVPGAAEEYQRQLGIFIERTGLGKNMQGLRDTINNISGVSAVTGGIKKEFELKNVK